MNSKNILIFLVFLIVYVNIFTPLSQENRQLKHKIIQLKKSIEKDKLYIHHARQINRDLNNSQTINEKYFNELFYNDTNTQVFNTMQKDIKSFIKNSNVHEDRISWGESYKDGKLIIFPLHIRISGSIKKLGNFYTKLEKHTKIHIKDITMQKTKEHYILKLSVYGVKWK